MLSFIFRNFLGLAGIWILLNVAFSLFSAEETVSTSSKEQRYIIDSHAFLTSIQEKRIDVECSEDTAISDELNLSANDVQRKGSKAYSLCLMQVHQPAIELGGMLAELIYTDIGASIPIAVVKNILTDTNEKPKRCSDLVDEIIAACPNVAKRYIKRIKIPHASEVAE